MYIKYAIYNKHRTSLLRANRGKVIPGLGLLWVAQCGGE